MMVGALREVGERDEWYVWLVSGPYCLLFPAALRGMGREMSTTEFIEFTPFRDVILLNPSQSTLSLL